MEDSRRKVKEKQMAGGRKRNKEESLNSERSKTFPKVKAICRTVE